MFAGTGRRIVSMWFPRFASDRALRLSPVGGPFALSLRVHNRDCLHALNAEAERAGLSRGMAVSEARAFCPGLVVRAATPKADAQTLEALRRWALRYCPWAACDGDDGLVLDITGAAHLLGGEAALALDMRERLGRAGFALHVGIAPTRGAAWALAHAGGGLAPEGAVRTHLGPLPVALLRLPPETDAALQRLGLRRIADLAGAARAPLARRFGKGLLDQLDRAFGDLPEALSPAPEPAHYGVSLTLPEPIGLLSDIEAGLARLLERLADTLRAQDVGARALCLTLRRVDRQAQDVPLRLAAPMRDPARILPLFARGLETVEAGFGIDQLRLEATAVEPMPPLQAGSGAERADRIEALMTRIGTRIGLDHVRRFQPRDCHVPERGFALVAAADEPACGPWPPRPARPLTIFAPEPIAVRGHPPSGFTWRRMRFTIGRATGPERIAPEWWQPPDSYGLRDYWRIDTREGRRLWLFFTPQNPRWFVQGEFL
ncbi:Y-family DNA polymerase [Paenirhodobacter enshiensis]|uniref:Y-family DNA polymerase n=1 Tax=Paenirhodobacter enshiensis TaxID=1105367 RepID=UPI003FA27EB9